MIYLDHNATTPLDPRVLAAMMPYWRENWGNPSSSYRFGVEARTAVEKARKRVAELIGGKPSEIIFTSGGTESDNLAVRGAAQSLKSRGNHIVTTSIEHHAVLNTCKALEAQGFRVTYLPVNQAGFVEPDILAKSLTPQTILITIMHANNETGVIQPVEEIAKIAKAKGIVFHTDAVQTAGKLPGRLAALGADLISMSAHKFYGPKGTGVLYVKEGAVLVPVLTGGSHERGLRAGTENVAGTVGLAEALALAYGACQSESLRLKELRDRLEARIRKEIPGVKIVGGSARRVPNTSSLAFENVDGEAVVLGLDLKGICASTGSACSTAEPEPSHVLRAMGLAPRQAQGAVRVSLGKDTRYEDIEAAAGVLIETVGRLRLISSAR
ncbi:MAG: cysteine desulfurase [Elusimicrobia bacterium]|nr:cysteine desulfurase [Elusimicrobiota bacterium]